MSKQCPKCGYAMDPFDETCKRCANAKETGKPSGRSASPTTGPVPPSSRTFSADRRSSRIIPAGKASGLLIGAWAMAPPLGAVLGFMCFGAALTWRKGEESWLAGLPVFMILVAVFELVVRKVSEGGSRAVGPRWLFYGCAALLLAALLPNLPAPKRHATSRPQPDVSAILEPGTRGERFTFPKKNDPTAPVEPADRAPSSGSAPVQRTTGVRQISRAAANAAAQSERQQADQIQRNLAASTRTMYPPRTQPPNWIPCGQMSGHWEFQGRLETPGSAPGGDDGWGWVDGNGRRVGTTVFVRPAQ